MACSVVALVLPLVGLAHAVRPLVGAELADSVDALDVLCEMYPQISVCDYAVPAVEKRKSAYMRFGRSSWDVDSGNPEAPNDAAAVEKRKSAYMRFGKRSASLPALADATRTDVLAEVDKRKSAYMRFGKRKSAYMRFGKRGEDESVDIPENDRDKRKSAYMRFGKRLDTEESRRAGLELVPQPFEVDKRKSAYMRFGR